ncbi:MAG: heat-inducible transcription repressor HrcA [Clostridia bacterium]|nr:heat-inducible transcription repressor HrcA [Clostridia bacterium]
MDRKLRILIEIVDLYIQTGEPVGSKAIADRMSNTVSSATIRNDMALLCEMGYLEQPHISAGRVPTAAAYRVYVNWLMAQKPSDIDKRRIYAAVEKLSSERIAENAGQLLSDMTGCVIVSLTNNSGDPIASIQVLPISKMFYTVLLITRSGQIKNRSVRCAILPEPSALSQFLALVNREFVGKSADAITQSSVQNIGVMLGEYFLQMSPFLTALYETAQSVNQQDLLLIGERHLFGVHEFDPDAVRNIMHFFSDRQQLFSLMDHAGNGISVTIGPENKFPQLANSSVITANYGTQNKTHGRFGVIAPVRADYKSLIAQLACFTEAINKLLDQYNHESED